MNVHDVDDGTSTTGPGGFAWDYGFVKPGTNISDSPFVDDPSKYPGGSTGYYVSKYIYDTAASVRVKQRAQYVQDDWQVTDRWLVQIGLRNDQFTNYNPNGDAFLRLTKPQWAPRLGFSWDVFGDSSFKVYGSAGRYYLAMPASVALRAAGGSLYTNTYYTYTGIDPTTGYPTGLTPIDTVNGKGQPVSANAEYGQLPDPNSVAAKNIKSQHQDEYVLGFDKQLAPHWTYGVSGVVRHPTNLPYLRKGWCGGDKLRNDAFLQHAALHAVRNKLRLLTTVALTPNSKAAGTSSGLLSCQQSDTKETLILPCGRSSA